MPLVEATRLAIGSPLIFIGAVRTSETNDDDVRAPRGLALIVDEPSRQLLPLSKLDGNDGTGVKGHRLGGVGDVLLERGFAASPPGAAKLSFDPAAR